MKNDFLFAGCLVVSLSCRQSPKELPPVPLASAPEAVPTAASAQVVTPSPSCPPDPDGPPKLPEVPLSVREGGTGMTVEFVYKDRETERGLMYRTHMDESHGMLFKMPNREQAFWMRNTCIPLDMLFLAEDGTIVGILEDVPILNEEVRSVHKPSTYVLEMNAGWARRHNVVSGNHVNLPESVRKTAIRGR